MSARGRTVILIGASSGIGAALARELARRGDGLELVARNGDALDALCAPINAAAGAEVAKAYPFDVCDYDAAPALFERMVSEASSEVTALIYNAGVMPRGGPDGWTFEDERAMLEVNAVAGIRWLGLGADYFKHVGSGVLVGVSSVAGERGRRGNSAYQASKAALTVYLESVRYRLRGSGVRVVTVKPGFVATPMTAGLPLPKLLVSRPDAVARRVADALAGGPEVVYVPRYLAPVLWTVRQLPAVVMRRITA